MRKLLIKGGQVVFSDEVKAADILIENGKIAKIGKNLKADGAEIFDAAGLTVFPGLIDMHVHLREPGFEYKEDIASGSAAAVAGGFTQVCCMPNTDPVCDNAAVVGYIVARSKEVGLCKVRPIGAITRGEKGETLAEMGKMKEAGAVAVSDDGRPVSNARIMRLAMEYASDFGLICLSHCEDKDLVDGGVVNEGYNSTLAGLKGIPRAAEEIMLAREIILAETLHKRVHICHVSTKGGVQLLREAKARGVQVTAETCPHYFTLTDDVITSFDANTKVNPPIREAEDVAAIREGLRDGTLDCIVTDHAPHHVDEKNVEYNLAAFGISGIETSFALSYTYLVKGGVLTLCELAERMSVAPARILQLEGGKIAEGEVADLMIADLNAEYVIDSRKFVSKGKNTPFDGTEVYGKVKCTIVDGDIKFRAE
ncbi:MAG TPA: dihydroorotase [Candidatus Borkfalkia avistercoris]|uniref:Dihydroorotase n=1 Tax=Candidatus Borkfalkia avistercoris TaxID=2838504 RepID=A0A9D2IDP1_9FIRM|nr:dihydroorotase [Candidatus Borkfalkia avistercoris]